MNTSKDTNCRLYILNGGLCMFNDLEMLADAESDIYNNREKKLSITCFLVKHPKGWLLWDTGLPDELVDDPVGVDLGVLVFSVQKTLVSLIEKIGITPHDIAYLTFSHMHYDHIGNSNLFADATFLIDEKEYKSNFNENSHMGPFYKYYNKLAESRTIKMAGIYDVFGDGCILTIPTPGHSPGHRSLFVNLPEMNICARQIIL